VGHSAASCEEVLASVPSGLTHAAHTFNAMVDLHHRQPGRVGAVLTCDGIMAEVIADNTHLHSVVARLLVRAKGVNRSVLVTDAIRIRHQSRCGRSSLVVSSCSIAVPNLCCSRWRYRETKAVGPCCRLCLELSLQDPRGG